MMKFYGKLVVIGVIMSVVCAMLLVSGCGNDKTEKETKEKLELTINVENKEYSAESAYDVRVYLDNKDIGKVDRGGSNTFKENVTEGKHVIRFASEEDDSIDGERNIYVEYIDEEVDFVLTCYKDRVNVKLKEEYDEETTAKPTEQTTEQPTEQPTEQTTKPVQPTQNNNTKITINVKCVENFIFSTYDVDVYVDEKKVGTLDHGSTKAFETFVTKGAHSIKFVEADEDDDPPTGRIGINVSESKAFNYKIECFSTEISVEDLTPASEIEKKNAQKKQQENNKTKKKKHKKKKHNKKKKKKKKHKKKKKKKKKKRYASVPVEKCYWSTSSSSYAYHSSPFCFRLKRSKHISSGTKPPSGFTPCPNCY